jgi:hypothetical protein|eukprot:COSAG01_NODE_139_length_24311_cov_75.405873_19_plen_60_part_00
MRTFVACITYSIVNAFRYLLRLTALYSIGAQKAKKAQKAQMSTYLAISRDTSYCHLCQG